MIPTHSILKLTLEAKAAKEENTFAKQLRSLKTIFLEKVEALTKGKEEKEQREINKTEKKSLKDSIEEECQSEKTRLQVLAQAKDTNGYWKLWSKTVERGWLRFAAPDHIYDKHCTGRGKVELVNKKTYDPKKKTYLRGKEARSDIAAVRQARRCEQMAFRIMLNKAPGEVNDKTIKYTKLNNEAIEKLKKHKGDETWETDLIGKLKTQRTGTQIAF